MTAPRMKLVGDQGVVGTASAQGRGGAARIDGETTSWILAAHGVQVGSQMLFALRLQRQGVGPKRRPIPACHSRVLAATRGVQGIAACSGMHIDHAEWRILALQIVDHRARTRASARRRNCPRGRNGDSSSMRAWAMGRGRLSMRSAQQVAGAAGTRLSHRTEHQRAQARVLQRTGRGQRQPLQAGCSLRRGRPARLSKACWRGRRSRQTSSTSASRQVPARRRSSPAERKGGQQAVGLPCASVASILSGRLRCPMPASARK